MDTLDELTENIPEGIKPIIHSDQGWHYGSVAKFKNQIQGL